jgi:hypothetical protein
MGTNFDCKYSGVSLMTFHETHFGSLDYECARVPGKRIDA